MNTSAHENEVIQTKTVSKPASQAFADAYKAMSKVGDITDNDNLANTLAGSIQVVEQVVDVFVTIQEKNGASIITARAQKNPFPDLSGQGAVKQFFDALERPDMLVRRTSSPVSKITQEQVYRANASRVPVGKLVKITIAALLVAGVGFYGFKRAGRPGIDLIKEAAGRRYTSTRSHWESATEIIEVVHGEVLINEGRRGPKGTKVYPVRITYSFHGRTQSPVTEDFYFWKNEFNDWEFSR